MNKKTESLGKNSKDAANMTVSSSQSHSVVNPPNNSKEDDLYATKSSPHRNVHLHHTRSFSEICHLHPSHTDVSSLTNICPRPRVIEELQHEVRRPESVLELSDLPTSSDEESDEDAVAREQEKGDEAMKIFLESNVSIPLDGNLTSSSLSQETLDSDVASESELIVGAWEREGRDSIASTGSGLEKRFLTPSGQLLYREHQADSMLNDTKRLKLTPSSLERPMSPLAARDADKCGESSRKYRMDSDSESDRQEEDLNEGVKMKNKKCNCDLRLQDLKNIVLKYEKQCDELISKSNEQYTEIKALRKDNANMHKEHDRLQLLVKECHHKEESLKGSLVSISKERDFKITELGRQVQMLGNNLQDKNSEISKLQTTVDSHRKQGQKYILVMQEINNEIKALFDTLAKELGLDDKFEVNMEENPEGIVTLLKTRRQSLSVEFKQFYKNVHSETNGDVVGEIQKRMKQDFQQLSSGYKSTISKIQKAENDLGTVLKRSASLETLLKQTKEKCSTHVDSEKPLNDLQVKLSELERKNDGLVQKNKMLQEDCSKWKRRCKEISERYEKKATRTELKQRDEKPLAGMELGKLKKYLKQRRRSNSETQLTTLQHWQVISSRDLKKEGEKEGNLERSPKGEVKSQTAVQNADSFKGLGDLERRLTQLSQLTENLSQKIEKNDNSLMEKSKTSESIKEQDLGIGQGRMLSEFYGDKLFSVIKETYDKHVATLQETINRREEECRYLKEQLVVKESNEEVMKCYIESTNRELVSFNEDFRRVKIRNQDLKRELRVLKDRVLVTNAEREMSLYYCKKNGVTNGSAGKHEECLDMETLSGRGHHENGFGINESSGEMSRSKKQIKRSEV